MNVIKIIAVLIKKKKKFQTHFICGQEAPYLPIFDDNVMRRYHVQRDLREPVMLNNIVTRRKMSHLVLVVISLLRRGKAETKMVSECESIYDLKKYAN